jgi:dihydroceramidase
MRSNIMQQLYYHYLQDPVFHQNAFAIITIVVVVRSMYMMEVNLRPSLRKKAANGQEKKTVSESSTSPAQLANEKRDKIILREMWWMVAIGLSIFLGGFAIWGLDRIYCSNVRRWRHQIGLPWGILLEGHGWW